jgi:DNA-binding CsgD family transcriptional regulator
MTNLTARECEVAIAAAREKSNKVVARALGISENTVKHHLKRIYRKLDIRTRLELALYVDSRFTLEDDQDALVGYWVSEFEYTSATRTSIDTELPQHTPGVQINIERIRKQKAGVFSHAGESIRALGKNSNPFKHRLKMLRKARILVGLWENSNSEHIGCFQLALDNRNRVMRGQHLGDSRDGAVQSGRWSWVKLTGHSPVGRDWKTAKLKSFAEIHLVLAEAIQDGRTLDADELLMPPRKRPPL